MADVRDRAQPTSKRDTRVPARPMRGLDEAAEQVAPLVMVGDEPRLMAERHLAGRGAGVWRTADVLAMQRAMGNQATQRVLASGPGQTTTSTSIQRLPFRRRKKQAKDARLGYFEKKDLRAIQSNVRNHPKGSSKDPSKDRVGEAKDWLGYGGTVLQTPSAGFRGFSAAAIKGHNDDDTEYFASSAEGDSSVGSASERAGLSSGAYGVGSGASLFAMGGSIATIAKLSKKLKAAEGTKKKAGISLEIAAREVQTGASTGQVGANVGASVAKGVVSSDAENSTAGTMASILGGVGNSLAAVGAVFEMLIAGAKGVIGLIKVLRRGAADKKMALAKVLENFLSAGKNFLATASSATFATSKFLTIAEKGAVFVQNVPFIGYAIDIAVQALDILDQTVKVIKQVIRMVRAKKYQAKMKAMATSAAKAAEQKLADFIGEANRKRFRRAIVSVAAGAINIVSNLVNIGGDIANIAGAASAGAMGAGAGALAVGYSMKAGAGAAKLGAASLKPLAWGLRHGKQKIRDAGAKHSSVRTFGSKIGIDMDKTSKAKQATLNQRVIDLLAYIEHLKDDSYFRTVTNAQDEKRERDKFIHAKNMIKASGLSPKDLVEAKSVSEMRDLLRDALRKRE